nr:MAG TPA: hypothetical protein [Caudoviricetes sp.]
MPSTRFQSFSLFTVLLSFHFSVILFCGQP